MLILMSTWTVLEDLKKITARKYFYSSTKDWKVGEDDKKSDGHISVKNYLMHEKNWDKFHIKDVGDYWS